MSTDLESFDREKAKDEVRLLIDKYEREKTSGRLESYSEEQTKNDFILRLFKALGWDVYNDHSNTLTAEEKASRGRVDYGFRINDIPKFFLEAKSFRAGVDKDEYAFQSINYSWLKGCTWAVLTNFEKLIIFNAEWKERLAINCLFISLNYTDFLTNFDQLYLLSREAFLENLLDKEAEKWHKKVKKTPIDQQLLQDLMKFRESLTQSIIRRNSSVIFTDEELDESVQKILDRIIFIRTVEDRQIEPPHLRPLIREDHKGNLWKKIAELYRYFDDVYDSNLFSPHECEKLIIGDDELETIIRGLHETGDGSVQYDFGAINVDVLGNVYEQYLGHILKKTKKSATIQDSSAKRKEQGIYYTPTYIVDYIVKNTVGSKIGEMGLDWKKIRILDPACGSGSFLIKAFDYLTSLDKSLEKTEEIKKELYGNHIATERFAYLKNNIFGVDLDTKATEIAQLNLMIRATEKKERLPTLKENIKHGNSLVDDPIVAGDNVFKWNSKFPDIIKNGGFDVVIGNPPYVRQEELLDIKPHLQANYEVYHSMADLFVYFFEKEMKLLKEGGYFGMIVNNKWIKTAYGLPLRKFLSNFWIEQFIDFGDLQIFKDATTYPCIIIMKKIQKTNPKIKTCLIKTLQFESLENYVTQNQFTIDQKTLDFNGWNFSAMDDSKILHKLRSNSVDFGSFINNKFFRGITTGLDEAFVVSPEERETILKEDPKSSEIIFPYLSGKEIKRNKIDWRGNYIIFTRRGTDISKYPAIENHLNKFRKRLEPKTTTNGEGRKPGKYKWYEIQDSTEYWKIYLKEGIIFPRLNKISNFTISKINYFPNSSCYQVENSDRWLLAILNSKLIFFYLKSVCPFVQGQYYDYRSQYVTTIPISKNTVNRNKLNELQDKIITLNERLDRIGDKMIDERTRIDDEIKKIDSEIDDIVFDIYELDEAERKMVKDSIK